MLEKQAENLWTCETEQRLGLGVRLPARMTVLRLPDGTLALVSPIPISDSLSAELAALGPVSTLIAPNAFHHLHVPAAARRYPGARLLAAPGVASKQPSLQFEPLAPETIAPLRDVLAARLIEGLPKMSEVALFHAPSRTLLLTDLVFNIVSPPNFVTGLLLACSGTKGKLAQSRALSWLIRDRAAVQRSSAALFTWPFERLVMAHGQVLNQDAPALLRAALERTLPRGASALNAASGRPALPAQRDGLGGFLPEPQRDAQRTQQP
jgi:hypothetical protein